MKVTEEMIDIAQRAYLDNDAQEHEIWGKIGSNMKAALQAVFDHIGGGDKVVEKGVWISGKKGECPVNRDTIVEVRYPDGSTDIDAAYKFHWNADVRIHDPVIAYRIIAEPKEESCICKKNEAIVAVNNLKECKCIYCGERAFQKQEKQTLAQYVSSQCDMVNALSPREIVRLTSEYLKNFEQAILNENRMDG